MSRLRIVLILSGIAAAGPARASPPPPPFLVEVVGPRMHLGDLVFGVTSEASMADLGPTPTPGSSRLFGREELTAELSRRGATVPKSLPHSIRVVRKMRSLSDHDVEQMVRAAIVPAKLTRGVSLGAVHAHAAEIPDGWKTVQAELPRAPRRTGSFSTAVALTLTSDGEAIAHLSVPVELSLSAEAATPDVARGAPVTLVVRRGLVEISAPGVASADADIGGVVPILIRSSGRVINARLFDKEHAAALEAP